MADGGRVGSGLLECWHVPIRATVLHYSISARQHTVSPSIANSNHPRKENYGGSALYWLLSSIASVAISLEKKKIHGHIAYIIPL